ncbi:unnamed protein product [Durusdinium trenchii]|uniref:Pentatricopeptide repeat-containing protein n=1 Tax=Durusdinium trenchii TaxID=1381693 RepID=A0ABP0PAX8_9DINO
MTSCTRGAQWQLVLVSLQQMQEQRLVADLINYNAVLCALKDASQWQLSLHMLTEMLKTSVIPDVISYSVAGQHLATEKKARLVCHKSLSVFRTVKTS